MIVRVIVVDPAPRPGKGDLLVYQVPENSRELELLQELCNRAGVESAVVGPERKKR